MFWRTLIAFKGAERKILERLLLQKFLINPCVISAFVWKKVKWFFVVRYLGVEKNLAHLFSKEFECEQEIALLFSSRCAEEPGLFYRQWFSSQVGISVYQIWFNFNFKYAGWINLMFDISTRGRISQYKLHMNIPH